MRRHAPLPPETRHGLKRFSQYVGAGALLLTGTTLVAHHIDQASHGTTADTTCGENIDEVVEYYQAPELTLPEANETITYAQAESYAADLAAMYDVSVTFQEEPIEAYERDIAPFDPSQESMGYAAALRSAADGLRQLPPELVRALELDEIRFVGGMDGKDGVISAAGLYTNSDNDILIAQTTHEAGASVVLHELTHALDHKLLCREGEEDVALAQLTSVPYQYYETDQLADIYTGANERREFAWSYGATSLGEDRATIMQLTFYERGLILASDADYGSPLRAKQAEIVRRLEELTPGVTDYLEDRTTELRKRYAVGTEQNILNPFKKDTLSPPVSIAAYAYLHGEPLTQKRGYIMKIDQGTDEEPIFIHHPILILDNDKEPIGILWNKPADDGLVVQGMPYRKDHISLRTLPVSDPADVTGLIETTSPSGDGFLQGGISIDGVFADQHKDLPDSLKW